MTWSIFRTNFKFYCYYFNTNGFGNVTMLKIRMVSILKCAKIRSWNFDSLVYLSATDWQIVSKLHKEEPKYAEKFGIVPEAVSRENSNILRNLWKNDATKMLQLMVSWRLFDTVRFPNSRFAFKYMNPSHWNFKKDDFALVQFQLTLNDFISSFNSIQITTWQIF